MVEALQALQDETIEKAVTKAVATMLPGVEEHFEKRFDLLEQSVERRFDVFEKRFATLEERLDKKIDTRFDEVIQAIQNISKD